MSQRLQAVAVAVFLLLVAGVVAVLLLRVDRTAPNAAPSSPSAGESSFAELKPVGSVSLFAGDGDLVVRTTAGSCTSPGVPLLELSDDQGLSWGRIRLPQVDEGSGVGASSPAVRAIVHADASGPVTMTVAAADAECRVRSYTATDRGATWKQDDNDVELWYRDPATGGVVSPNGPTDPGCKRVSLLAPISKNRAKAFCAGGSIRATATAGQEWVDAGELEEATAAVFTGALTGYAAVPKSNCQSRIYSTTTGGASWQARGCLSEEFAIPALTGTDDLLIGGGSGGVRLSTDGGDTWEPPEP